MLEKVFSRLIDLVQSLSDRDAETKREGLDDEQKAIFDILRSEKNLTKAQTKLIKKIAVELLEQLKREKLNIEDWWTKQATSSAVHTTIYNKLFESLPDDYGKEEIKSKTATVYEHLVNFYRGRGRSQYKHA